MERENIRIPVWFWIVSIFFLLWNIMGVFSFVAHTFISSEAMAERPSNEIELYAQYPIWTSIVFAIAVIAGLLGSIALVLKKKCSRLFFAISLLAVIPQMVHNVFFTTSIDVYGLVQATVMPSLVVIFGIFLLWFSMFGIKKQWLK